MRNRRNIRNTRKSNVVVDSITNKNFIIIISLLIIIIITSIVGIKFRNYNDQLAMKKQAEELEQ